MNKIFKNLKSISILILICFLFLERSLSQSDFGGDVSINFDYEVLDSYIPLFYEGRPLAAEEADMKLIADVEVRTIAGNLDASKFYYYWEYNDQISHTYSRTGGNIIYFSLDELYPVNKILLKVYTNNRQEMLLAQKTITFRPKPVYPILYKYDNNPILMYANAMNKKFESYEITPGTTIDIQAEPFYFSVKDPSDRSLRYIWSVNNIPGNVNYSNRFTYTSPTRAFNDFGIGLKISNSSKVMQSVESKLNFKLK